MKTSVLLLGPDTLQSALERATQHALACGALQSIETERVIIENEGVPFLIRRVPSLMRKEIERAARPEIPRTRPNRSCPSIRIFFVAEISDTHIAPLNRFNVSAQLWSAAYNLRHSATP